MNILLYKWGGFNEDILEKNLIQLGYNVKCLELICNDYNTDINLAMKLMEFIRVEKIEGVFSFNFFPIIAVTCNAVGVKYYSWVYDCPHTTLFSNAVKYDTNIIGLFDKKLFAELREKGINTVRHIPLAVDCEELSKRINKYRNDRGICDISFVGSLYTDKNTYYDNYKNQDGLVQKDKESWNELDKLIQKQVFEYKKNYINKSHQEYRILEDKIYADGINLGPDYFATTQDIVIKNIMERKVTIEERKLLIEAIAKNRNDSFWLYTNSNTSHMNAINKINKGIVDYINEMPSIFHNSRINLNISLRSIRSGIPLRALDILGCEGFLLSNYQEELEECFDEGEEIALYSSKEECLEKISFYLKNDDIRDKIAKKGRNKVLNDFCYNKLLNRFFVD